MCALLYLYETILCIPVILLYCILLYTVVTRNNVYILCKCGTFDPTGSLTVFLLILDLLDKIICHFCHVWRHHTKCVSNYVKSIPKRTDFTMLQTQSLFFSLTLDCHRFITWSFKNKPKHTSTGSRDTYPRQVPGSCLIRRKRG